MKVRLLGAHGLTRVVPGSWLVEFRRHKGYLPRIMEVHMVPWWQKEIEREVLELAREIEADITLGYEGMEVEI